MQQLPGDVDRLIASAYSLPVETILNLCKTNRKFNQNICRNEGFWRSLGQQRLTSNESLLSNVNKIKRDLHHFETSDTMTAEDDMIFAGKEGYETAAANLLDSDPDSSTGLGTALEQAVTNGHLHFVEWLLEREPSFLVGFDNDHVMEFMHEGKEGFLNFIKNVDPRLYDKLKDRLEDVYRDGERFRQYTFNPDDIDEIRAHNSLLGRALFNGHFDIANLLVEQGEDVHIFDDALLKSAAFDGRLDIVEFLVGDGLDPDAQESGLEGAIRGNQYDIVEYLLDHGADVHEDDERPLGMAISHKHIDIAKLLLDRGATIKTEEYSHLDEAAVTGNLDAVKMIVERGPTELNETEIIDYNRAARFAAKEGHPEVFHYLKSFLEDHGYIR